MKPSFLLPTDTVFQKSFDGYSGLSYALCEPDRYKDLLSVLRENGVVKSIKGAGLNLSMASGTSEGLTIDSKHFNRILDFDKQNYRITVEPGLRVGALIQFLISQNLWVSVLPGHPNISVGGCVAMNTHGKGQGLMSDVVAGFKLFHPQLGEVFCSPTENTKLFFLTLGGFGLTGFITQVQFKLEPLKGFSILQKKVRVRNLIEAADVIRKYKRESAQVYSWNNLNKQREDCFGRGYVYVESFNQKKVTSKIHFIELTANNRAQHVWSYFAPFMGRGINRLYDLKESWSSSKKILGLFEGSFPISGKEVYYSLFGNKGYLESQVLIPWDDWEAFVVALQGLFAQYKPDITLASLKVFNSSSQYLNFSGEGVVLAINLLRNKRSVNFLHQWDQLVIEHNGLPNIYKDSRLDHTVIKATYKNQYENFLTELKKLKLSEYFRSELTQRVFAGDL